MPSEPESSELEPAACCPCRCSQSCLLIIATLDQISSISLHSALCTSTCLRAHSNSPDERLPRGVSEVSTEGERRCGLCFITAVIGVRSVSRLNGHVALQLVYQYDAWKLVYNGRPW